MAHYEWRWKVDIKTKNIKTSNGLCLSRSGRHPPVLWGRLEWLPSQRGPWQLSWRNVPCWNSSASTSGIWQDACPPSVGSGEDTARPFSCSQQSFPVQLATDRFSRKQKKVVSMSFSLKSSIWMLDKQKCLQFPHLVNN